MTATTPLRPLAVTDLLLGQAAGATTAARLGRAPLRLRLEDGRFGTLTSLVAALHALRSRLPDGSGSHARIAGVLEALAARRAETERVDGLASLDAAAMASAGTLAALRRVSRDNLPMSTLVDRAARTLRDVLAELGVEHVLVGPVAGIDRQSLKVFARAALLSRRTAWSWAVRLEDGPSQPAAGTREPASGGAGGSRWLGSREQFLERIGGMAGGALSAVPAGRVRAAGVRTLAGACTLLSDMNYDACWLWLEHLGDPLPADPDAHRLAALLAMNTGMHTEAEAHLRAAYDCPAWPTKRANLAYSLALLWAKRLHDLERSDRWLALAMRHAEQEAPGDPGDPALEQGWVLNGYALNALLRARIETGDSRPAFRQTFDYVRQAFARVERGDDPERVYLRFNLLGNMSTLLAIERQWDHALRVLDEGFLPLLETFDDVDLAHLQSERAALLAQSGRTADALALYRSARDALLGADRPVCGERLNRSAGVLERRLGRLDDAEHTFAEGVRMALEGRSRQALAVNAAGLAACRAEQGRHRDALAVVDLASEQGVSLGDAALAGEARLRSIQPPEKPAGLGTSLPEVDLEYLPAASIAGALRGSDRDLAVLRAAAR